MALEICECVVLIEQVTEVVVIHTWTDPFYTASVPVQMPWRLTLKGWWTPVLAMRRRVVPFCITWPASISVGRTKSSFQIISCLSSI